MGQLEERSNIDKVIKQLHGTEVPNLQPSNYKSDGSWSGNTMYIGQIAINNDSNQVWYAYNSGITELTNQTPDLSGYYTSSQTNANFVSANTFNTYTGVTAPNLYVDIAGDTMTGNLTLAAGSIIVPPLKFQSGDLLNNSEVGAIEFNVDDLYIGITTPDPSVIFVSQYPPNYNDTYVKSTSNIGPYGAAYQAANPANSLIGDAYDNSWASSYAATNERFHIDLGSGKIINRIYYENFHHFGSYAYSGGAWGAKNFTFWGSNSPTAFAELTYAIDTDWTELACSVNIFDQHSLADESDPKYISITNTTTYRYYAIKIADSWQNWIALRRIELQYGSTNYRKAIVLTDDGHLPSGCIPIATTNGRLINSIISGSTSGITIAGPLTATTMYGNLDWYYITSKPSLTDFSGVSLSDYITYTGVTAPNSYLSLSGGTITGSLDITNNLVISGNTNILGNTLMSNLTATTMYGNLDWYYITSKPTLTDFSGVSIATFNTYTGVTAPNLYVDIAGDTMTGNLTITPLSASTERIITTSGSGLLQNYLQTNSRWITNSTLISQLIATNTWVNGSYTGTTTGAVEGQMYIGNYYLYLYQNSLFTRYLFSDYPASVLTVTTTGTTSLCNIYIASAITLYLPVASTMVFENIHIKNISTGDATIVSTSLIDGQTTQTIGSYSAMNLKIYNGFYWIS